MKFQNSAPQMPPPSPSFWTRRAASMRSRRPNATPRPHAVLEAHPHGHVRPGGRTPQPVETAGDHREQQTDALGQKPARTVERGGYDGEQRTTVLDLGYLLVDALDVDDGHMASYQSSKNPTGPRSVSSLPENTSRDPRLRAIHCSRARARAQTQSSYMPSGAE